MHPINSIHLYALYQKISIQAIETLCLHAILINWKVVYISTDPSYIFVCFAAGEMMSVAEQFLEQQMHPTVVIGAYRQALEDILKIMKEEIR